MRVVGVPGLIPDAVFYDHLAHRRFPVTVWIRKRSELDYLVEPDLFHDFFGHVPCSAIPCSPTSCSATVSVRWKRAARAICGPGSTGTRSSRTDPHGLRRPQDLRRGHSLLPPSK